MALVDPNIAMSFRMPEFQAPNALAQYAQIQQIQGGRQAQELNALKMQEARATMEERNALRQLNPSAADYESQLFKVSPQLGIQYRKEAATAAAQKAAQATSELDLKAKQRKFGNDLKRELASNPSDENIIAFGQDAVLQGLYTPDQVQATVSQLLALPAQERVSILSQSGATVAERKPTVSVGPTGIVQTPAFGGPATVVPGTSAAFQMTPAQIAANKIAQQQLGVSQGQLSVAQQRAGFEGERVGIARTEAERKAAGGDLKPVPVHAQKAITGAASSVNKLTDAIDLLSGLEVAGQKGSASATGIKGYAPDIALNRLDPKGTVTRAAIADIGSMIMHDRSGAAVTASESPRLKPFIPLITDSVDTAKKKLERLRQIQLDEAEALTGTYNPEQGFKLFTAPLKGGKSAAPAAPYSNMSNEELLKQLSGGK